MVSLSSLSYGVVAHNWARPQNRSPVEVCRCGVSIMSLKLETGETVAEMLSGECHGCCVLTRKISVK